VLTTYEYTYSIKTDLSAMLLYANSILLLGRMFKHLKNYKKYVLGDIVLPKKTEIIVSFISMYRNEKYWPNPLKFDPDRFSPKRMKDHSYYYTPFSDGPRSCIGKHE